MSEGFPATQRAMYARGEGRRIIVTTALIPGKPRE